MKFVAWSGDDPRFPPRGASRVSRGRSLLRGAPTGFRSGLSLEIEATIKRIKEAPDRWPIIEQDVRKCLAHVFPYSILYTIEQDAILIVSVMHLGRRPGHWRNRLSDPFNS